MYMYMYSSELLSDIQIRSDTCTLKYWSYMKWYSHKYFVQIGNTSKEFSTQTDALKDEIQKLRNELNVC